MVLWRGRKNSPCTSETFALETQPANILIIRFSWNTASHFEEKGIGSKYSGWLFFWGRHGAVLLLLSTFSLISSLSPSSDDHDTGAMSEPLVSHIRKALHTQLYITQDVTDLISNILLLKCWNRHSFGGT